MVSTLADILAGKKVAFFDCGKRGGAPILKGIEHKIRAVHKIEAVYFQKTSAHSCASKKLIEEIASGFDAAIYGVVSCRGFPC